MIVRHAGGQEGQLINHERERGTLKVRLSSGHEAAWIPSETRLVIPQSVQIPCAGGQFELAIVAEHSIKNESIRSDCNEYKRWLKENPGKDAVPDMVVAKHVPAGVHPKLLLWSNDTARKSSYVKIKLQSRDHQGQQMPLSVFGKVLVDFSLRVCGIEAKGRKGNYEYSFDAAGYGKDVSNTASPTNLEFFKGSTPETVVADLQNRGEATLKFRVKNVTTREHNFLVSLCVQATTTQAGSRLNRGLLLSSPVHVLSVLPEDQAKKTKQKAQKRQRPTQATLEEQVSTLAHALDNIGTSNLQYEQLPVEHLMKLKSQLDGLVARLSGVSQTAAPVLEIMQAGHQIFTARGLQHAQPARRGQQQQQQPAYRNLVTNPDSGPQKRKRVDKLAVPKLVRTPSEDPVFHGPNGQPITHEHWKEISNLEEMLVPLDHELQSDFNSVLGLIPVPGGSSSEASSSSSSAAGAGAGAGAGGKARASKANAKKKVVPPPTRGKQLWAKVKAHVALQKAGKAFSAAGRKFAGEKDLDSLLAAVQHAHAHGGRGGGVGGSNADMSLSDVGFYEDLLHSIPDEACEIDDSSWAEKQTARELVESYTEVASTVHNWRVQLLALKATKKLMAPVLRLRERKQEKAKAEAESLSKHKKQKQEQ